MPPAGEASPPTVQSLSLAVVTTYLRLSLQITLGLLAKGWGSQLPTLPKATDEKPTLRTSQKDGEQLGKKMLDDWKGNTAFPERAEVLAQDIARCRQKLKEEEEKGGLLRSNTCAEQDLKERVSLLLLVAETLLHAIPALVHPRQLLDGGSLEVKQKWEVGTCKHHIPGSEVALKADMHDADSLVFPQSPERARSLREEKQVNEKLRKQTAALQAEETSLRCEILQLESRLRQLKLQNLLELHQELIMQLESQISEEEKRCAEIEKKLSNLCRNWNYKFQFLQLHKNIAEDMGKELERTRSFYQRKFLLHEKRAQKSWKAAVQTERDLMKLREGDRIRQMLAGTQAHLQPFPSGLSAPVALPTTHGGHKLSLDPLNPQAPPGRKRVSL
ncbi:cTAGE family member 2 [Manis javanica]|nr:cTAGE family member 2 [Manis javanica]